MAAYSSNQIRIWADQYLKGTISIEDKARFEDWYNALPQEDVYWLDENIKSAEELKTLMYARIKEQMEVDAVAPKNRKTIWLRRLPAAAVLVLAVGLGFYFLTANNNNKKQSTKTVAGSFDVAPGGNKATLTLANGAVVLLDSVHDGTIAQQANTRVSKSADGQLVYNNAASNSAKTPAAVLFNTLQTPRGGQYQLVLPDGTKVWLDAASSIKYPVAFTQKQRNVSITGQAYFEVAKDAARPFVVDVNGRERVEVLGTHFNIMAYPEAKVLKTTLLEGKIRLISAGNTPKTAILLPGNQAVINNAGEMKIYQKADVDNAVAWKNNYFVFRNSTLQEALQQLARWYAIEVVYKQQVNILLNGRFKRSNNLSAALKILEEATGITFKIEGKRIVVGQ